MTSSDDRRIQVAGALRERFFPLIPPLAANWTAEQHDKNRLSRSLAALAIGRLAGISPAEAANSVVDGGNDNGVDALHFDRSANRLWVVQAKAGGPPDLGDCKKFIGGVLDILTGQFSKFNSAFSRLQPDIEEALATDGLKVVGCVVHQGDQLGSHCTSDLNQVQTELNQFVDRFEWRDLSLATTHGWLTAEHEIPPVDVNLTLESWHGISAPRRAFYGLVRAVQLAALYEAHGKALLEKNIRHYLGAQAVNAAIAATAAQRPTDFYYLNNGLTAVCSSITPSPGGTNTSANFTIRGFSVVNGAQTVGSIAAAARQGISPEVRAFVTIIEVAEAQDAIGPQITRARNTQNAVRGIHFAALDPQQERLRQEMAVSGVRYEYRPSGETAAAGAEVITIARASMALACLSGDTRGVVAAKHESGLLYDGSGEQYAALFRPSLSGIALARAVQIYDHAMEVLFASELAEATYSRRKMFYRHGRFFILHIFARRHRPLIERPEVSLSDAEKTDVSRAVTELAELIYGAAEVMFRNGRGYLSVFRSLTDCVPLAADVMQRLAQPPGQAVAVVPAMPPDGGIR